MSAITQNNNYYIESKCREDLGRGSYSIALADGHKTVLLVTTPENGAKIDKVRSKILLKTAEGVGLDIPQLVGSNLDLATLINPSMTQREQNELRKLWTPLPSSVWKTNRVYLMPKYDGTLDDLSKVRFKEDSIKKLDKSVSKQLGLLHANGLVHRDVEKRNIYYTGTYPDLKFHLGDFGKVSENPASTHARACEKDMHDLQSVICDLQSTFEKKYKTKSEMNDFLRDKIPSMGERQRKRSGRSPLKVRPALPLSRPQQKKSKKQLFPPQ